MTNIKKVDFKIYCKGFEEEETTLEEMQMFIENAIKEFFEKNSYGNIISLHTLAAEINRKNYGLIRCFTITAPNADITCDKDSVFTIGQISVKEY